MTAQERIAGVHERLQRRTLAGRLKKALMKHDRDNAWTEHKGDDCETDALVKACFEDQGKRFGLTFESLKVPKFTALLTQDKQRKKIRHIEEGLERAHEIYGASRSFIGLVLEVGEQYCIYTGNPSVEISGSDFMRLTMPDGQFRYICSFDGAIEGILQSL